MDTTANYIFGTLAAVTNNSSMQMEEQSGDTNEEIRQNTLCYNTTTQQRTVTLDDYKVRAMSMPSEFGTNS